MGVSSGSRLRIGVVGLGRLWEARHKPALAKMRDRIQIISVYDQVARRAATEAANLRCEVAGGMAAMIARDDIEAIYVLTPQWFGLHPIRLACEHRKPIYCGLSPAAHPENFLSVAPMIRESGVPFMPELARRSYPATLKLRELLGSTLGPPRLVLGHTRLFGFDRYGTPGPSSQLAPSPLTLDPGSYLIDWCRFVFDAEPIGVTARSGDILPNASHESSGPDYSAIHLQFTQGRAAQIEICRYNRPAWGEATRFLPTPGFQVFAERGVAWLELPDRIQWSDSDGLHDERMPLEPSIGQVLNDQFLRLVRGEPNLAPNLDDALAVVKLGHDVQRSLEGLA